jgi:hypothetical protein
VAGVLAERYGLRVYSSDATMRAHSTVLCASTAPLMDRFRRMGMDERWVQRDPVTMYWTFPWFHGEGFQLLLEDLRELAGDHVVLAEGFRLCPSLVHGHMRDPSHAVWLIPDPDFRRAAFMRRSPAEAFWLRTSDPSRALDNLLERDRLFTDAVASEATQYGLRALRMDGTHTIEQTADAVAASLGLSQ